jgi:hypothetical protein
MAVWLRVLIKLSAKLLLSGWSKRGKLWAITLRAILLRVSQLLNGVGADDALTKIGETYF